MKKMKCGFAALIVLLFVVNGYSVEVKGDGQ
jgi:hypothetical protein